MIDLLFISFQISIERMHSITLVSFLICVVNSFLTVRSDAVNIASPYSHVCSSFFRGKTAKAFSMKHPAGCNTACQRTEAQQRQCGQHCKSVSMACQTRCRAAGGTSSACRAECENVGSATCVAQCIGPKGPHNLCCLEKCIMITMPGRMSCTRKCRKQNAQCQNYCSGATIDCARKCKRSG